jgi:hypothetical protein
VSEILRIHSAIFEGTLESITIKFERLFKMAYSRKDSEAPEYDYNLVKILELGVIEEVLSKCFLRVLTGFLTQPFSEGITSPRHFRKELF